MRSEKTKQYRVSAWPEVGPKLKLQYPQDFEADKDLIEFINDMNELMVRKEDFMSLNGDVSVYGWENIVNFALFDKYNFFVAFLKKRLNEANFEDLMKNKCLDDFVYVYCTILTLLLHQITPEDNLYMYMKAFNDAIDPDKKQEDNGNNSTPPSEKKNPSQKKNEVIVKRKRKEKKNPSQNLKGEKKKKKNPSQNLKGKKKKKKKKKQDEKNVKINQYNMSTELIFKESNRDFSDEAIPLPKEATIVLNSGAGNCGYLAFGQWLKKHRNFDNNCNQLRTEVNEFDLEMCPQLNTNEYRKRQEKAKKNGEYMQEQELNILACKYNVCVVVYRDYTPLQEQVTQEEKEELIAQNPVLFLLINPRKKDLENGILKNESETVWLYNSNDRLHEYAKIDHWELLENLKW